MWKILEKKNSRIHFISMYDYEAFRVNGGHFWILMMHSKFYSLLLKNGQENFTETRLLALKNA